MVMKLANLLYTRSYTFHIPDEEKIATIKIKSKLCDIARSNPLKSLNQIYRDYTTGDDLPTEAEDGMVPDFVGCKTQMYNARRENFPPLPKTKEEVHLEGTWTETTNSRRFVLHQDQEMVILSTDSSLQILATTDTLLMDGTFKAAPKIYKQLFTIHGVYRGHCIPLVSLTVIDQLKRKMAEKELILNPTKLMCDFEAGLIPALRTHFPNSAVKGCYFHHTKALWAHVQDYGLVPDYNSDRHVKKVVRLLMALAFLPVLLVRPNFIVIEGSTTVQDSPKLQQLCDYYKSTWLNGSFPVALWNVNNQTLRTNNLVEGWHNKLNRGIGKIHPNLFEVITYLQKEQRETELTVSRARLGAAPPTRRPKYKKLEERITNLTQQHTDGTINSKEFLRQIRHVVHQF